MEAQNHLQTEAREREPELSPALSGFLEKHLSSAQEIAL